MRVFNIRVIVYEEQNPQTQHIEEIVVPEFAIDFLPKLMEWLGTKIKNELDPVGSLIKEIERNSDSTICAGTHSGQGYV